MNNYRNEDFEDSDCGGPVDEADLNNHRYQEQGFTQQDVHPHSNEYDDEDNYSQSKGQKDKMYKKIYHKMMKEVEPTVSQNPRLINKSSSPFDTFKDDWNKIQDKSDKEY